MQLSLKKPIRLKDGTEVAGVVDVLFDAGIATVEMRSGRVIHLKSTSIAKALGYGLPDNEQLGEWVCDSTCESLDGCTVEPDGTCEHGFPSWLLAMGLM
jgi:hypothetical protein